MPVRHSSRSTGLTPSRVEQLCIERGLKITWQRRVIARVLSDTADYLEVEKIYARALQWSPHISIATVYRTLRLLEENNIILRYNFSEDRARYDAHEQPDQQHIIDVDTGQVTGFLDLTLDAYLRKIVTRLGFDLVSCHLQLFGRKAASPQK